MRRGASLIELIFTIVVMGISMAAIPPLLVSISKSNDFSINQEAILAGVTKVDNILTYEWDESNTGSVTLKHVLDVNSGDNELDRFPTITSTMRRGHFVGTDRRKFWPTTLNASAIGIDNPAEATSPNDIDDFNGRVDNLIVNSASNTDYVKDFRLETTVAYVADATDYTQSTITFNFSTAPVAAGTTTNIKMVEVRVVDLLNNETVSIIRSFASNIGSTKLLTRTFN